MTRKEIWEKYKKSYSMRCDMCRVQKCEIIEIGVPIREFDYCVMCEKCFIGDVDEN